MAGLLLAAVTGPPAHAAGGGEAAPLLVTQAPLEARVAFGAAGLPAGARIVAFDPSRPEADPVVLTPGFEAAGRPDVSFDGQSVLFVGRRRPGDQQRVWSMRADGTELRAIDMEIHECARAIHLSVIYTIEDLAPARQIAVCGRDEHGVWALFTCRPDGSHLRRITFNPYGAVDPCQLADGRIVFSSVLPPGDGGVPGGAALHTVNTDGTDVFVFTGKAYEPGTVRGMPRTTADGRVLFVEGTADGDRGGGALVVTSPASSLHERRVLVGDRAGWCRAPAPLDERTALASYRSRGGGSWGIRRLDLVDGRLTGTVLDDPRWHELDAVALRPHPEPAGRSSVVDERRETGSLYCLDASLTGAARSPSPDAPRASRLQVYAVAGPTAGVRADDAGPRRDQVTVRLVAEVPIETDGSFHLEVPARTPLRLRTLDADGRLVLAMQSWVWVMPREARGCIGCHEDRELTPPNRHVLALRKPPHRISLAPVRELGEAGDGGPP